MRSSFVIAKQHPFDLPNAAKPDKTVTNFWIIRVADKTVIGPLTKEEFETRRNSLGVPPALQFTKEFPDLAGVKGAPNRALLANAYPAALRASDSAAKRGRSVCVHGAGATHTQTL
jgi:hypothetical protein